MLLINGEGGSRVADLSSGAPDKSESSSGGGPRLTVMQQQQ